MRDANHQNEKFVVPDFVHDTIVPHPDSPQTPQVALQRGAEMRGFGQPVNGGDDAHAIRPGHTPQLLRGALLNPYREAHA